MGIFQFIVAIVGTLSLAPRTPSTTPAMNTGDSYSLDRTSLSADGRSVQITVVFGGGCANHVLTPHTRQSRGATEIWLTHQANNDRCEALLNRNVTVPLRSNTGSVIVYDYNLRPHTVR